MRTRVLLLAAGTAFMAAPAASQSPETRLDAAVRIAPPVYSDARLGARTPEARTPADSLRPPDAWLGRDKVLHFGASFLLTLSGQYVLTDKANLSNTEALPFSVGAAFGLGIAKEVADSRRAVGPHFSLRDLAVDALGVAVGVLVTQL